MTPLLIFFFKFGASGISFRKELLDEFNQYLSPLPSPQTK